MLLVSKFINSLLPPVFNNWFTFCSNVHDYETTSSATCKLFKPSFPTHLYRKNSITVNATDTWNKAQTSPGDTILKDLTPNKIKTIIMKKMIDSYKLPLLHMESLHFSKQFLMLNVMLGHTPEGLKWPPEEQKRLFNEISS